MTTEELADKMAVKQK